MRLRIVLPRKDVRRVAATCLFPLGHGASVNAGRYTMDSGCLAVVVEQRTFNLRINGPLLYQLRYTTLVREEGFEPPETRCRRFYGPVAYSRMATGAGIEPAASSSSHSRSTGELHRSRGLLGLKFSGGGPAGVEPAVGLPRPLLRRLRLPIPPRTHLRYLVSPAGVEPAPPFRKTSFSGWRVFV